MPSQASRQNQIKWVVVIFALFITFDTFSDEGDVNFSIISAAKKLDNGKTLYSAAGNISEEFSGKIFTVGIADKLKSGVGWRLGYFGYYPKNADGGYKEDHRVRGVITNNFDLYNWKLASWTRLEYRMGQVANGFRLRPMLNLSRPIEIGKIKISPYVEVEPFYDFRQHHITLTLFTAGLKIPVGSVATLRVGQFNIYLNHPSKHSSGPMFWLHLNL